MVSASDLGPEGREFESLAGASTLCSWAKHLTLTVPLSTKVYKWEPANCLGITGQMLGGNLRWTSVLSRGIRHTSSRFILQKLEISAGLTGLWPAQLPLGHNSPY